MRTCESCGISFLPLHAKAKYCSLRCKNRESTRRRALRDRSSGEYIPPAPGHSLVQQEAQKRLVALRAGQLVIHPDLDKPPIEPDQLDTGKPRPAEEFDYLGELTRKIDPAAIAASNATPQPRARELPTMRCRYCGTKCPDLRDASLAYLRRGSYAEPGYCNPSHAIMHKADPSRAKVSLEPAIRRELEQAEANDPANL